MTIEQIVTMPLHKAGTCNKIKLKAPYCASLFTVLLSFD